VETKEQRAEESGDQEQRVGSKSME
jgi:hypothetical protein